MLSGEIHEIKFICDKLSLISRQHLRINSLVHRHHRTCVDSGNEATSRAIPAKRVSEL